MGGAYTPRLGAGLLESRLGPALGGGSLDPNRLSSPSWAGYPGQPTSGYGSGYSEDGAAYFNNLPGPPWGRDSGGSIDSPPAEEKEGYDWAWNSTNLGDYMSVWPGLPFDPSGQLGGAWYFREGVGWVPEGWQDPRDAAIKARRERELQWRQDVAARNSRGRLSTIHTSGRGLTSPARVYRPSLLGG